MLYTGGKLQIFTRKGERTTQINSTVQRQSSEAAGQLSAGNHCCQAGMQRMYRQTQGRGNTLTYLYVCLYISQSGDHLGGNEVLMQGSPVKMQKYITKTSLKTMLSLLETDM